MRALLAALLGLCSLALAACGGPGHQGPPPPVRLTLTGPGDGAVVRGEHVQLTGRVVPAAAGVSVGGEPVTVQGGRFSTAVALDAGGNVIDVMATAPQRSPALTAVRVIRQLTIRVPDVRGTSLDGAVARLSAAGLRPRLRDVGDLIDKLLPTAREVCGTEPGSGVTVDRGATVDVLVAKLC
ncbi:MAG: hypothetical protein QOJ97_835 [Solirubrobacteraceae bacterium]|jgi:hypothetical protein|nr:hypothetical protein [Solirubrobacteraceae bacterium]